MATRALLYRRPAEPATLVVKHGSQFFAIRLRRHRRARRYTLRIHPTDREAILTMPPRGTLAEAKEFAQLSRRLDRRTSRPFAEGRAVSSRHSGAVARRCRTGSCIAPASAARCGPKSATAARRFSASPAASSISTGASTTILKREARKDLQKASQAYAEELGVRVKRVSIRDQSSRWGSCTSAGSLSFSWRLILAPPYVLDYLAAHEVAHLVEMNHSARFWRVVGKVCGHVERAKTWLDTHGNDLHRYGIQD